MMQKYSFFLKLPGFVPDPITTLYLKGYYWFYYVIKSSLMLPVKKMSQTGSPVQSPIKSAFIELEN
jgi:hypothetical protein